MLPFKGMGNKSPDGYLGYLSVVIQVSESMAFFIWMLAMIYAAHRHILNHGCRERLTVRP